MKRGRGPTSIHEPSTYRNGGNTTVMAVHHKLRPAKKQKCSHSEAKMECPLTTLNVQRRVLRYSPEDSEQIIPNRRQISLQERNATWITLKDFRRMQKETADLMECVEANSKLGPSFSSLLEASNDDLNHPPITSNNTEEEPTLVPPSPSSISLDDETIKEDESKEDDESQSSEDICLRGLEQHTKVYLATKQSVQRLMHETVQKIRTLESQDSKDYSHVLAQLCQVCSATAIANAQVLGERDAQAAAADEWSNRLLGKDGSLHLVATLTIL